MNNILDYKVLIFSKNISEEEKIPLVISDWLMKACVGLCV